MKNGDHMAMLWYVLTFSNIGCCNIRLINYFVFSKALVCSSIRICKKTRESESYSLTPRGGGVYSGFQVTGLIEWGQKSRPKKNP